MLLIELSVSIPEGPTAMPEWWWNALGLALGLGLLLSGAITVRVILLFVLANLALDLWIASAD